MSHHRSRQRKLVSIVLFLCLSTFFLLACANTYLGTSSSDANTLHSTASTLGSQGGTAEQSTFTSWDDPELPFYGMEFVPIDDLETMQELGINMVLQNFAYEDTPREWLEYLDAAHEQNIRVVAWLWPEGWSFDRDAQVWEIDDQARLFLNTIKAHPALFAVYALHEPYWNECEDCGYTTAQQQALYQALKAIADVPVYSEVDSMSFWTEQGEETAFADGICDYCATYYYPFRTWGAYERDKLIERIAADMAVARDLAPNSRVVWAMQGFAQGSPFFLRMPTTAEMHDLATVTYSFDIAGAWWYPWSFNDLYRDTLSQNEELHPAIRDIYDTVVIPRRPLPPPLTATVESEPSPTPTETGGPKSARFTAYLPLIFEK